MAARSGARIVVAEVPFPVRGTGDVVERVLARVTGKTRLLLVDHVTSPTALVLPVEQIVRTLAARGVDTLVDGAHAPGMLPLDLGALDAAYYTGNLHKWVCAPKGCAFLSVRADRRDQVRPLSISHGANSSREDRSRYLLEFDWTGTFDPSAWLSVPTALEFMGSLLLGGWTDLMARNHALALAARDVLASELGIGPPAPDEMIGSMATLPLPDGTATRAASLYGDALQDELLERDGIEVPVVPWPRPPKRLIRVSAQAYNDLAEYERLADALRRRL
jgi:isopenicillin-N epimerase